MVDCGDCDFTGFEQSCHRLLQILRRRPCPRYRPTAFCPEAVDAHSLPNSREPLSFIRTGFARLGRVQPHGGANRSFFGSIFVRQLDFDAPPWPIAVRPIGTIPHHVPEKRRMLTTLVQQGIKNAHLACKRVIVGHAPTLYRIATNVSFPPHSAVRHRETRNGCSLPKN